MTLLADMGDYVSQGLLAFTSNREHVTRYKTR